MKKLICIFLALSIFTFAFAEINPSSRIFELGFGLNAGVSNNYFALSDLLTEEIVLDFNKISDDLSKNGLRLNLATDADFFINVNTKKLNLGFFVDADIDGYSSVPKALIDFIANGNVLDVPMEDELGIGGTAYAVIGASVGWKFKVGFVDEYDEDTRKSLAIKLTPQFFMPVFHVPNPQNSLFLKASSNGSVTASANADVSVYTPFSLENFDPGQIASVFSSGGLDFTVEAEYPLFKFLDLGVRVSNFPLKPAKLNNATKIKISASASIDEDGVLGYYQDELKSSSEESEGEEDAAEESSFVETTYNMDEIQYLTEETSIYRPFKIAFLASYRPLNNNLLILKPMISFKFKDPASAYNGLFGTANFDMDLGITVESRPLKILRFSLDMLREEAVWKQQFGFALDLRLMELNFAIGSESNSFIKSFTGPGLTAGLAIKFGF